VNVPVSAQQLQAKQRVVMEMLEGFLNQEARSG